MSFVDHDDERFRGRANTFGGAVRYGAPPKPVRAITRKVAQLVLETFVGPKPPNQVACHYPDPSVSNNQLSNLRWDTYKANCADKKFHGTENLGSRNHFSVLKDADIPGIRLAFNMGVWMEDIARAMHVDKATIYRIVSRRTWNHI